MVNRAGPVRGVGRSVRKVRIWQAQRSVTASAGKNEDPD